MTIGTPYLLPSSSLAAAATWSGSKPNFLWSSLSGAEAPNVFMPMMRPAVPTYRSRPVDRLILVKLVQLDIDAVASQLLSQRSAPDCRDYS
jgi:hypothetical protein